MIKYTIDNFEVKNIWFADDNFFVSLKRTRIIAREIIKEKYDLTYDILGAYISLLNKADHKHIRLLEKSGCRKLYFGIESGSPKILNKINKNISILDVIKFNQKIGRYNLTPNYNFMVGFPFEGRRDIKKTMMLILRLLRDNKKAQISTIKVYTPYPKTELFEEIVRNGYRVPSKLKEWDNWYWSDINANYISKKIKKDIKFLTFLSLFFDDNSIDLINSKKLKILKLIILGYKPIIWPLVKWRYRSNSLEK